MGLSPSRSTREARVLLVGLDFAGKTTILYKLGEVYKAGEVETTIPIITCNVETVKHKKVTFTSWQLGQNTTRPIWRQYYQDAVGIIFVVDGNDRDRIDCARDELYRMLNHVEALRSLPLLVFANKQDIPCAMNPAEITDKLGLNDLQPGNWHVQGCCATTGDGLKDALDGFLKGLKHPGPKS